MGLLVARRGVTTPGSRPVLVQVIAVPDLGCRRGVGDAALSGDRLPVAQTDGHGRRGSPDVAPHTSGSPA